MLLIMELTHKELKVMSIIKRNRYHFNYFFRNCTKERFFPYLLQNGFFDLEKYPIKDEQGSLQWPQLEYLHKLLKQTSNLDCRSYCEFNISVIIGSIIKLDKRHKWVDDMVTECLVLLRYEDITLPMLEKHLDNVKDNYTDSILKDEKIVRVLFPYIMGSNDSTKIELMIIKMFNFNEDEKNIFGRSLSKGHIKLIKTIYKVIFKVKDLK